MPRSHLSIWNQFLWKILSQKVHFVCFWKCWAFKLSITPPYYSLTTMHSTLHSVHHRKTGRETISLKLNDPLKNRYEPSRRSLNRKQRPLFLDPQCVQCFVECHFSSCLLHFLQTLPLIMHSAVSKFCICEKNPFLLSDWKVRWIISPHDAN